MWCMLLTSQAGRVQFSPLKLQFGSVHCLCDTVQLWGQSYLFMQNLSLKSETPSNESVINWTPSEMEAGCILSL